MLFMIENPLNNSQYGSPVSADDRHAFKLLWSQRLPNQNLECCTASNFRVDVAGTPQSAWNQSAAWVFTYDYIRANHLTQTAVARVHEAFITRLTSLRAAYRIPTDKRVARRKRRKEAVTLLQSFILLAY
jgi:hypothetical protein